MHKLSICIIICLVLSACALPASVWPQLCHDGQHSSFTSEKAVTCTPTLKWMRYNVNPSIFTVTTDNQAIINEENEMFYIHGGNALSKVNINEEILFDTKANTSFGSLPALSGDGKTVYVTVNVLGYNSKLAAIDQSTGATKFNADLGTLAWCGSPLINPTNKLIYISLLNGGVLAVEDNETNITIHWHNKLNEYAIGGLFESALSIDGKTIYSAAVVNSTSTFQPTLIMAAYDSTTGSKLWSIIINDTLTDNSSGESILRVANDGRILVTLPGGDYSWVVSPNGVVEHYLPYVVLAVGSNNTLFVTLSKHGSPVLQLNSNYTVIQTFAIPSTLYVSAVTASDDVIYVSTEGLSTPILYCFQISTGYVYWEYQFEKYYSIVGPAVIINNNQSQYQLPAGGGIFILSGANFHYLTSDNTNCSAHPPTPSSTSASTTSYESTTSNQGCGINNCNGHGKCVNGACECYHYRPWQIRYSGALCDESSFPILFYTAIAAFACGAFVLSCLVYAYIKRRQRATYIAIH